MKTFADPTMQLLLERVESHYGKLNPITPANPEDYFANLSESIMGQQLSEKVVPKIIARVRDALANDLSPENILRTPHETLRGAGLSNAKAQYIRNIAEAWDQGEIEPNALADLDDETVITTLSSIKGVGRWTAEMFLIFTLGRPDIFSSGDYGLRRGISLAYHLPMETTPKELTKLAENWKPQRSLASRILWKSLDLDQK